LVVPFIDTPFERCQRCNNYVMLDQTVQECATEHRCRDIENCPLKALFEAEQIKLQEFRKPKSRVSPSEKKPCHQK
jgi:hypothetical protein